MLFFKTLKNEGKVALFLCLLVTPIVAAVNSTASLTLILIHASVFSVCIALCSSLLIRYFPKPLKLNLIYRIAVRLIAVVVSTALALPIVSVFTGISITLLVSKPLFAALVPVVSAYIILAMSTNLRQEKEKALLAHMVQTEVVWQALTAQIRPHFLFNCLNGLELLVDTEPERAKENLRRLAAMYRSVLNASEKKTVVFNDELKLVTDYLQLQQMRYDDRLQYTIDVPKVLQTALFPATLLLTLVENSIKHGIEKCSNGGTIKIQVSNREDTLLTIVENPVNSEASNALAVKGFGTSNIDMRLSLLFGNGASYRLQIDHDKAAAILLLPLKLTDTGEPLND